MPHANGFPRQGHCERLLAMAWAKRKRTVEIGHGICRCIGASPARAEAFGYGRRFESSGVFFSPGQPLQHQETISRDTQACVMMESSPVASFVMADADLLLEFPVVPLDAPAHLDDAHQFLEGDVAGEPGQMELARLRVELARVKMERDILKKATAYFARESA